MLAAMLVDKADGRHNSVSVTLIVSLHSYIENQQDLQHLESGDLKGLDELRNL